MSVNVLLRLHSYSIVIRIILYSICGLLYSCANMNYTAGQFENRPINALMPDGMSVYMGMNFDEYSSVAMQESLSVYGINQQIRHIRLGVNQSFAGLTSVHTSRAQIFMLVVGDFFSWHMDVIGYQRGWKPVRVYNPQTNQNEQRGWEFLSVDEKQILYMIYPENGLFIISDIKPQAIMEQWWQWRKGYIFAHFNQYDTQLLNNTLISVVISDIVLSEDINKDDTDISMRFSFQETNHGFIQKNKKFIGKGLVYITESSYNRAMKAVVRLFLRKFLPLINNDKHMLTNIIISGDYNIIAINNITANPSILMQFLVNMFVK